MITKEFFLKCMDKLIELDDQVTRLNEAFKNCYTLVGDFLEPEAFVNAELYTLLVDTLDEALCPQERWVSWWIYENNLGKEGLTVKVNGEEFTLDSAGELYNFIGQFGE